MKPMFETHVLATARVDAGVNWMSIIDPIQHKKRQKLKTTIAAGIVNVFTMSLGLLNWLVLRDFVIFLSTHYVKNKWAWRAIDIFSFTFFGMVWLVAVYLMQHYYEAWITGKAFLSKFLLVTGVQILFLFICHAIPIFTGYVPLESRAVLLMVGEFLAAAILFLFYGWLTKGTS